MMIEPFGEVVEDSRNSRGPDLTDRARGHGRLKDPVLKVSVDCRWLLASQWMRLSDPGLNPHIHAYVSGNMRELCTHTQHTPILV